MHFELFHAPAAKKGLERKASGRGNYPFESARAQGGGAQTVPATVGAPEEIQRENAQERHFPDFPRRQDRDQGD